MNKSMIMNKFFLKRFRTFFLYMIIPTVIIYIVFIVFMTNMIQQDLQQQSTNSLSGVKTNLDLVVRDAVYQQDLMTNNDKLMLSLKSLLMNRENYDYTDDIFMDSMQSTLRSIVYSHSYIDSIYWYIDGFDYFFTSSETSVTPINNYYDVAWYQSYRSEDIKTEQWVEKRSVKQYTYTPAQDVLTIYQRMSSMKGVIIININEQKLKAIINTIVPDRNESFYLLNQDNSMIFSNKSDSQLTDSIQNGFFRQQVKNNQIEKLSKSWVKIEDKRYLVNAEKYSEYNIGLVSLISEDALIQQNMKFLGDFIFILLGNCLIVFFLAYITTRRIFLQINYMIKVFSDAEQGKNAEHPPHRLEDEYDVIMNNIIHLFLKTTQMNNQLLARQHQLEVAELTALQLQINPHFLLNTLQTMDLEAMKQFSGPTSINIIIHDLSDILKYALGDPLQKVTLREELVYLKEYVSIQQYRFGNHFIVYYEVGEELMNCQVFRLMLQPLLENSILHGVRRLDHMGYIKLKVASQGDFLSFRVIDNGVGMSREEIESLYVQINDAKSRSIGLTNVNRRLVLEYGQSCGLRILGKQGKGTRISFRIPYKKSTHKQNIDTLSQDMNNK